MKLAPLAPIAAILVLTGITSAVAQAAPPQRQLPPCYRDFIPLRTEAQKRGEAIQAAAKRKAGPRVICGLFRRFSVAEAKMVKYAVANEAWCGIPAQAVKQMKESHAKTLKIRARVCEAAAHPPRPRGPSLSDALGIDDVPNAATTHTGRGTYDSLTGNPLDR